MNPQTQNIVSSKVPFDQVAMATLNTQFIFIFSHIVIF